MLDVLTLIQSTIDRYARKSGNWIQCSCPFSQSTHAQGNDVHPSFGISCTYPHGYNCFSCGKKGVAIEQLLHLLGFENTHGEMVHNYQLPMFTERIIGKIVPIIYSSTWLHTFPLSPCHPYITARNVPISMAQQLEICYDSIENRICFPIYDRAFQCIGLQGRSIGDTYPKYKFYFNCNNSKYPINPGMLYGEQWINFDAPLVIVEGVFDVARVKEVYGNVTSFFGVNPSTSVLRKLYFASKILMFFDQDTAGDNACIALRKALHLTQLEDVRCNIGYKDPSAMPLNVVRHTLKRYIGDLPWT
jgi:DNA primase